MSRALAAIVRFERASRAVTAATKAIADALAKCAASSIVRLDEPWPIRDSDGNPRTHLWEALNLKQIGDHGYLERLGEEERRVHLEYSGCPHCLQALDLIEQRKAARQELGIAKRALRSIGRAAIAKDGQGVEG